MQIDLFEAFKGYSEELHKQAEVPKLNNYASAGADTSGNFIGAAGNAAASTGGYALDKGLDAIGYIGGKIKDRVLNSDLGKAAIPIGGALLANSLGGLPGTGGAPQPVQPQSVNVNFQLPGQKPAFFNNNNNTVGSLINPTFNKQADVAELLNRTIQARIANSVIDKVVDGSKDNKKPHTHQKEIEITSKYPEMSKILENKENKAYLERLLKE
jgi:hypothetical protein